MPDPSPETTPPSALSGAAEHPANPAGQEPPQTSDATRYGVVLLLLLATFVDLSAAPAGALGVVLSTLLQAVTLLAALFAARASRLLFGLAIGASVLSLAGAIITGIAGHADQRAAYFLVDFLLIAAAPAAIIVGIVRRGRVDVQTVLGALCIYILLGLLWTFLDAALNALGTQQFFAQVANPDASDFVYFSFVTLTTTGYGDLTAAHGLDRAVAVLEALVGQLYLVTVVALLVSNLPRRRV